MTNKDTVEFYEGDQLLFAVDSSMVPPVGSKFSIRKKVFEVVAVNFAIDYADNMHERRMRCNVELIALGD